MTTVVRKLRALVASLRPSHMAQYAAAQRGVSMSRDSGNEGCDGARAAALHGARQLAVRAV